MNAFFTQLAARWEELLGLLIEHMEMTSLAVLVSLAIGVPVGILITKNKRVSAVVIGIANLMQSIPSIGLLAFMVPFVGIGQKPAIIMVVVYALLPIIKNTYTGITSIDPKLIEASKGIGLSRLQQLTKVQLPLAMPFIMAGVRISAVTAVGTVTIAAFAGAGGLGWMINLGLNGNDAVLVLLGAIPACLLALLVDFVLGKVEKAITPEGLKPTDQIVYLPHHKRVCKRVIALLLAAVLIVVPAASSMIKSIGNKEDKLVIGAQNFTESIILGYIYSNLIESNTDIPVDEKFNLNGTMITMAALESGDIDMFTDYVGVISANVLKLSMELDPREVYDTVVDGMAEKGYGISPSLGSSNGYILAVTPEIAERYQLTKLSQLIEQAPDLRLGCTTSFIQREDLLPKLQRDYHLEFEEVTGLEGNIRYQAIASGEIDVTDVWETDAMLMKTNLIGLEDDINFFPPYDAINVYRGDLYEKYPELEPLLAKLDGILTNEKMIALNYAVDVEGKTPEETAIAFLKENDLIPEA